MTSSLVPTLANPTTGSGVPFAAGARPFMTPWLDYSSIAVPDNQNLVMWWAQFMWLTDGNYRTAMERVASHFITELEFPDLEADEESAWRDFFTKDLNYRRDLIGCIYDYLCYGNSFVSLYLPFKRFMRCRQCALDMPIDRVPYTLQYNSSAPYLSWNRVKPCPRCGDTNSFDVIDRRDLDLSKVRLNRYDPNDIELAQNRFSLKKEYYWRIPDYARRDLQARARIHIDDTPLEILEAIAVQGRLSFDEEMMLHQDEITVSGVQANGWGVPRSIANFRTAWLQQLTNKLDQAVTIDYTLGMRVISPAPTPGATDPMQTMGMENFVGRIGAMVKQHRNNPVGYYTSPYPLQYQFLGGEGDKLLPPEKLKFRQQEYLNQLGIPLEYHQMSLGVQAAPMALRLFESYWQNVPAFYNRILDWLVETLSRVYDLEPTKVQMQKTTIADDMERKAVLLQLMTANQLSPQTALRPFNINVHEEAKKVIQHQAYVAKLQQEQAEKDQKAQEMGQLSASLQQPNAGSMAQQQQGGAAGGAPMAPGAMPNGAQPTSLDAMSQQADQIAQQLAPMPEYERGQELRALRESNPDLHALVTSRLEKIRSQAASQGQQMVLQGGGGQPA